MWQLILLFIFIILLQRLSKTLQEQPRRGQQGEVSRKKIEDLFQILGFPLPEEIPPKPERPKEPIIVKRKTKKPEVEIAELKPAKIEPLPEQVEKTKEGLPTFSQDKLQEGIILSVILGPPKAHQIRRSGEIGRHV